MKLVLSISLLLGLAAQGRGNLVADVILKLLQFGVAVHHALLDAVLVLVDLHQLLVDFVVDRFQLLVLLRDCSLQLTELLHELAVGVLLFVLGRGENYTPILLQLAED